MNKKLKVLNAYSGIGGNRKLWTNCEVTAIEMNPDIAKIYQDFFPDDKVIVGDAHEYLLNHFAEFDFIWSSPPCQSHSRIRFNCITQRGKKNVVYPDMKLYQEIILLQNSFSGPYVIENVIPYYDPLMKAQKIGRHLFWSNFHILSFNGKKLNGMIKEASIDELKEYHGFQFNKKIYMGDSHDPRQILRNCVNPELGLHIFNCIPSIKDESNFQQPELLFS